LNLIGKFRKGRDQGLVLDPFLLRDGFWVNLKENYWVLSKLSKVSIHGNDPVMDIVSIFILKSRFYINVLIYFEGLGSTAQRIPWEYWKNRMRIKFLDIQGVRLRLNPNENMTRNLLGDHFIIRSKTVVLKLCSATLYCVATSSQCVARSLATH